MINILPQPNSINIDLGQTHKYSHISFGENNINECVLDEFYKFSKATKNGEENVCFSIDERLEKEEYILKIAKRIEITAGSANGEILALQTLKQIVCKFGQNLPQIYIQDKPKYEIRGLMLDPGRYFIKVSDVKKYIDIMAMLKLNLLHLHLTEDQGFRAEIKKYPLLTEVGSKRTNTNFNKTPHEGFYTKEDIKEIVEYANSFGIKVMPEFDIPGHCRAAIAAYNNLTCFPRDLPVATHWGVKHDVLCVGKDETMQFVYDVIDELCEMFPDEYFHIGGDEVPKHRWKLCKNCQAKMHELGLDTEDELQFWFMNTVKDYCKSKGKQVFMWSWDLKETKTLDNDLGFSLCQGDSNLGERPFIDTSTSAYYVDLPYGRISLYDTANHKVPNGNCKGLEATLWGEYIKDIKKGEYMLFPRILPACETAWGGECNEKYIRSVLDDFYLLLKKQNLNFADLKTANPSKLRGIAQNLWFEKRQLTWEGLHNIFDDKKIEKIAKK